VKTEILGNILGLTLARSAFIGSGQDGVTLAPYIVYQQGENRQVSNFEADTQQEAIESAYASIEEYQKSVDAWAISYEGFVTLDNGEKQDIYIVKAWIGDLAEPIMIYQMFNPKPFKLIGNIKVLNFEDTGLDVDQVELLHQALDAGIESHSNANEKWDGWF
jgi:hypothetical protein